MAEDVSSNASWRYLDLQLRNARGGRTSLELDDHALTYAGLYGLACRAAAILRESGVRRQDRVVVALGDGPTFVACAFAAMRIGAIAVPVNPSVSPARFRHMVLDCRPRAALLAAGMAEAAAVLTEEVPGCITWNGDDGEAHHPFEHALSHAAELSELAEPHSAKDAAWLQYTSGSTGNPKGAIWSHGMLTALPDVAGGWYDPEDRCYCTSKLSSGYAFLDGVLLPLSAGAASILRPGRIDPLTVAHVLQTRRPTLLYSLPTMYAAMLAVPDAATRFDFSSVRRCVSSGEHLPAALAIRFADEFGVELVNEFGSSEAGDMLVTEPGRSAPGSCGRPLPGVRARVVDELGHVLPDERSGFLEVQSAGAAVGYWNRPDATRRTFREGWVHTGDIVRRQEAGDYIYIGRLDDIINIGGVKTIPADVEEQLMRLHGIAACAVVATEGDNGLPVMTAFVVPAPAVDPDLTLKRTIRKHLRRTVGSEHSPRNIVFSDALPATVTGKTSKGLLRQERISTAGTAGPADEHRD
jgi:acyl-coenzyme A synthetase/AMP-(fatty) acid ligase